MNLDTLIDSIGSQRGCEPNDTAGRRLTDGGTTTAEGGPATRTETPSTARSDARAPVNRPRGPGDADFRVS